MKITQSLILLAGIIGLSGVAVAEDYFDGKKPLLCSMHQLFQCDAPNACRPVTPEEIAGFAHLNIDFDTNMVTRAGIDSPQESPIENVETRVDGKLIIQGIEDGSPEARDGAGWSISIMNPEGTMSMAVAGDGFVTVGLGACVPRP